MESKPKKPDQSREANQSHSKNSNRYRSITLRNQHPSFNISTIIIQPGQSVLIYRNNLHSIHHVTIIWKSQLRISLNV